MEAEELLAELESGKLEGEVISENLLDDVDEDIIFWSKNTINTFITTF